MLQRHSLPPTFILTDLLARACQCILHRLRARPRLLRLLRCSISFRPALPQRFRHSISLALQLLHLHTSLALLRRKLLRRLRQLQLARGKLLRLRLRLQPHALRLPPHNAGGSISVVGGGDGALYLGGLTLV